jgi:hypothetical protein
MVLKPHPGATLVPLQALRGEGVCSVTYFGLLFAVNVPSCKKKSWDIWGIGYIVMFVIRLYCDGF